MTRAEIQALKKLAADPEIVIKNADKGSGIVIEDRDSRRERTLGRHKYIREN